MQATRNDVDIACSSSSPPTASNVENDQEPVVSYIVQTTRFVFLAFEIGLNDGYVCNCRFQS